MSGRLIGVVGPSGVGKDSVMVALAEADPSFGLVRRVITRAPGLGGEDYDAVTEDEFVRLRNAGAFCVDWQAHGLHYGVPERVRASVENGDQLLVNLSRSVLTRTRAAIPQFVVLSITASPKTLAARLSDRGRESEEEIARRLQRRVQDLPEHLVVHTISNDGPLEDTVSNALAVLQPARA